MSQNIPQAQAVRQMMLIGLIFLMAGLGALIFFSEPTPLLFLGVIFIWSSLMALRSDANITEVSHVKRSVF